MDGTETSAIPALKRIIGALIFGAKKPLTPREIRKNIEEVSENLGGMFAPYASLKDKDIRETLASLTEDVAKAGLGFILVEGPEGYLYQSDADCGPWLRHLLDLGRGQRLSRPALETLAIIAFKQPFTKADIEAVRGVSVDHILKTLMESQLVRIMGRSDLPGRPLLYGTTNLFLEHFGLKDVTELPKLDELARLDTVRRARAAEAAARSPGQSEEQAPAQAEPAAPAETEAELPQTEPSSAGPSGETDRTEADQAPEQPSEPIPAEPETVPESGTEPPPLPADNQESPS